VRPSWACHMYHVDCLYPPLPTSSTIWYVGRAIYTLSAEEQFLCTQSCCHSVLWHWFSLHHHHLIISYFRSLFLLTFRKSKLNLFRLSLYQFSN
jgi:hypothetical protein